MAEPDSLTWILASLLGGLVGMDAVSWPQVMISRPLVSATVGGALLGDPGSGFLVGAILELLVLRHPPFGAARYPDTGPAGLVAGAAFAGSGGHGLMELVVAVAIGWILGWIGARSVRVLRDVNGWLVEDVAGLSVAPASLERRQRLAVGLDFARGALLSAVFLVPAAILTRIVPPASGGVAGPLAGLGLVLATGAASGSGAAGILGGRGSWLLLAGGSLAALALLWLT
jgi:hypothetical protein